MKGISILTVLLLSFCLSTKAEDFQVVIVSGDVKLGGSEIKPSALSFLKKSQTVHLGPDAYLLLVDNVTNIYEFKGETSILLDTLRGNVIHVRVPLKLDLLYSEKTIITIKDDSQCLVIVKPFYFGIETTLQDTLTLSWVTWDTSARYFVVSVENQFGDVLLKRKTAPGEYSVFLDFRNFTDKELFIQVNPYPKNEYCGSGYKKLRISTDTYNATEMNKNTAGTALLKALFLEKIGLMQDAEGYYEEAARLGAGIQEYQSMLSRFRSRSGNEKD